VYGRMHWDRPASTLTGGFACCGRGRFIHPLRRMRRRECSSSPTSSISAN
jgi:site-specific DNA-cytosine methylase